MSTLKIVIECDDGRTPRLLSTEGDGLGHFERRAIPNPRHAAQKIGELLDLVAPDFVHPTLAQRMRGVQTPTTTDGDH